MINSGFVVNYSYFQENVELLLNWNEVHDFCRRRSFDALRTLIISVHDQS